MHLELAILNGDGYISTIDDNDKSLVCEPVTADDISKLAEQYSNDDNYVVGVVSEEKGLRWIVEDKNHPRKLMEAQQLGLQQAAKKIDDSKQALEFGRFKQDCRKRALDCAFQNCGIANPTPEVIMKVAQEYYEWLIKE